MLETTYLDIRINSNKAKVLIYTANSELKRCDWKRVMKKNPNPPPRGNPLQYSMRVLSEEAT
jgi:hypothetical protein